MHIAANEGRGYTVERLVNKGADINIKDKEGVSVAKVWMVDLLIRISLPDI